MKKLYKCTVYNKNGKTLIIEKEGLSESAVRDSFLGTEFIPLEIKLKK